jgi:hypothetical protein
MIKSRVLSIYIMNNKVELKAKLKVKQNNNNGNDAELFL